MVDLDDARLQLDQVLRDEAVLLKELKDKEARIRILLAELKALQNMKKEATQMINEETQEAYEEEIERHRKERELESIDELVEDVEQARQQSAPANPLYQTADTQPLYNLQDSQRIATVTSDSFFEDLYAIKDKELLTTEDIKKAFSIASDVLASNTYEVNSPAIQQKVSAAYDTLKDILTQRPDIVNQYKSQNNNSPVNQFIQSLKKNSVTDYKQ